MTIRSPLAAIQTPRRKHRRDGRILLIVLLLLGMIGGSVFGMYKYGVFGSGTRKVVPLTDVVFRGEFDHIVLEQGEIESSSNIDVICEVKSRGGAGLPILWVIDEGTYVKTGDKLCELDASALENDLKSQRIVVSSAEATLISSAATVRTAEISLQEYLEGTYLSERTAILSEIAVAEQELRKTELNLDSARRLAAKGMLKGLQIEAEEFSVVNAKSVLESANARLLVLDRLTKEKNKVQFESDIEAAKARMKSDESVLSEELDKLREIEEQIAKCVMYSPAEGVVVHNNEFSSRGGNAEFVVEQGATVREGKCIIKLPDPSKMQVKAKVNESRISLIAAGMAAKVKVGSVEKDMLARVKKVNKYAEPGSFFSSSVKEYATFIEILNPPESIRTGMTAECRIFVEQLKDALQIPVHGVYEFKGHHFCLVQEGEGFRTQEIKIGATNEKMVTIAEGLEEGDRVALDPRNHLDLLKLPEIADVSDRAALVEIGADAEKPTAPAADGPGAGAGGPGAGGPRGAGGRAGQGGGPGGPGGAGGGFDPTAMINGMFDKYDSDKDGQLSSAEIEAITSPFKDRIGGFDKNGDGQVDKAEITSGMQSFGGGGGGGGPRP
jgi:HlyD family secretion protein